MPLDLVPPSRKETSQGSYKIELSEKQSAHHIDWMEVNLMTALSARHVTFPDLDIVKLLMALFVVEIHTRPLYDFDSTIANRIIEGVDCLAVPFFFIASSFLCFRGYRIGSSSDDTDRLLARIKKTQEKQLSLYVIWSVLLLPLALWGLHIREAGLLESIARLIRGFVFVGQNDFTWPLWYLLASVIAFGLVFFMLRGGCVRNQYCSYQASC